MHEAFAQPGRSLTQVAEMPDGTRFFGLARITLRGGGWQAPRKRFAIGLGCELSHARELACVDGLELHTPRGVVPVGPGCRVCPRTDCVQRAFPPAGKTPIVDSDAESLVSYRFESGGWRSLSRRSADSRRCRPAMASAPRSHRP